MTGSPDLSADETRTIRAQLTARINAATHPSRLVNLICLADSRCSELTKALARLIARSPKALKVIRAELRKAFALDPDRVLFTENMPLDAPRKVDTLTDRALLLLVRPSVAINIDHFTTLSLKEGDEGYRVPYTPRDMLQRVIGLNLLQRLAQAVDGYWQALVPGSWLTRREHWLELHKQLFAARAFLARQLDELSAEGIGMVQALIDAPSDEARQRAGGQWATVRVGQLMWPGTPAVAIPGALHIYREGEPAHMPHIVYLPGVVRHFYEYRSFVELQCGVLELERSLFRQLWQCLPLNRRNELCSPADLSATTPFVRGYTVTGDALDLGAEALREGQWGNELNCLMLVNHAHVFSSRKPAPLDAPRFLAFVERTRQQLVGHARLGKLGNQLLKWDHQRRRAEIIFANITSGLPWLTAEHQVKRYEKGLVGLFSAQDASTPTAAYQAVKALHSQLKVHSETLNKLMQEGRQRLLDLDFWAERPGGAGTARRTTLFMHAQTEALRCEVELQHSLKLIPKAHRKLVIEVLDEPRETRRPGSETRVLSIAVGSEPDAFYPLYSVWVITTAAAVRVPARPRPVVLYAFGADGGVSTFVSLEALSQSLKASLGSRDDSVLWGCVERDKRKDLRAHAVRQTLAIRYVPVKGKPALTVLRNLLGSHDRLDKSAEDITRIFTEVADATLSRALLRMELEEQLKVPLNDALSEALANIELQHEAMSAAQTLPAWLLNATAAQRKAFNRLQRLHLASAYAFKSRLEQRLPDLGAFARGRLIARLSQDGFVAPFDIDQPFIDIPDDVQSVLCTGSGCSVGDRDIVYMPSETRSTFSLLQLALHNLDPEAPWTRWRLDRARYLRPDWKQRLNIDYLIQLVSSLDIGGQYEASICQLFQSSSDSSKRLPQLLNRTLKAGIELHLFSAIHSGLTVAAQSLFKSAMAARTPQDLRSNNHDLKLQVVHLVGHTMQHDRYIAGILVVEDRRTGLCVVYWPEAAQPWVLTEYVGLPQALDELNRIGAWPDNVKALARQVAPGWAFESISHHLEGVDEAGRDALEDASRDFMTKGLWRVKGFIRSFKVKHLEPTALLDEIEKQLLEQIASDSKAWLAIVETSHSDAVALLYRASVLGLHHRTQAASQSGLVLEKYRKRRLADQSATAWRRVVGFFNPLAGMFNDFYELLLVARNYHRYGDARDAVDVGFMSALLAIDTLQNFVPGPKKIGGAVARLSRPALRAALGRLHRLHMTLGKVSRLTPSPARLLKSMQRFRTEGVPKGAVALKGPTECCVHVKSGQPFVTDDTHHYPVYRRGNEPFFRLKNQQAPGEDELILNIHQPGEWLLGADAPQPVAGTSSGRLQPWRAPVASTPDWRPPQVRMATEQGILRSVMLDGHWLNWRSTPQSAELSVSPVADVFHFHPRGGRYSHDVLRVAPPNVSLTDPLSGFYRLLPQGGQPSSSGIRFIGRDVSLSTLARIDIRRWTTTELIEQPLPVSLASTGERIIHAPLFDRSLERYVEMAFPGMRPRSQTLLVDRLVTLADASPAVTSSHLLNIRATLDNWLTQTANGRGQTDDLLRMLVPRDKHGTSLHIGLEDDAIFFTRIDFEISGINPVLFANNSQVRLQRQIMLSGAFKAILERQGYRVEEVVVRRYGVASHELLATHPASTTNNLYYLAFQWVDGRSIQLKSRFTDRWFNTTFKQNSDCTALLGAKRALAQRRLIRIVAGVQWHDGSPTAFLVKVNRS